jgi:signal peptidase II
VRPFDGDFVWLLYVLNPGFAFGVRILPPLVLKIFALLAASALGYYLFTRWSESLQQNLSLSLIMGGAIGNLIDRIRIGEVIDFLSVDFPDFIMDRFPVFNVADSMVSIGVVLWMLHTIFSKENYSKESGPTEEIHTLESTNSPTKGLNTTEMPDKEES